MPKNSGRYTDAKSLNDSFGLVALMYRKATITIDGSILGVRFGPGFRFSLTQLKQIHKLFTTEAQRHREKHFVLLIAPVAQLTK